MSVINQMLKDLESRRTADTSGRGLLRGGSAHGHSSPDRKWLLLSLLIALLALSLAYLLWERFTAQQQTAPALSNTAEAAASPVQVQQQQETNTPTPPADKPRLTPVPVLPAAAPEPAEIVVQETSGATATASPALHAIEPATITGSRSPQTLTLTGDNLPQHPRIKVRWRNGEKVLSPTQVTRQDSKHLSISLTTGVDNDTWTVTLLDSGAEPLQFHVQAPPTTRHAVTDDKKAQVSNDEAIDSGIEKRMRPLHPEQRAEQLYQQGYLLLQRGDQAGAEKQWDKAIQIDPAHVPGREGLAGLYLNHGRNVEASGLLEVGLRHHPGHAPFATLSARIHLLNGQLDTAIVTLERALATKAQDADFHAFLAALYQQQKAFEKSVAAYRQALQQQPEQGVWWMGAGISLEGAGKPEEAINAYNEALNSGKLSPKLRTYVEQRLSELQ